MSFAVMCALWLLVYVLVLWLRRRGRLAEDLDRDWLSIGALALLTIGFFWRPLLAGDVWMPADGGDLASFLYPTYRFAAEWLRQGIVPLWNPHLYAGMPFIGDIQSGLLYPPYILTYLLTPTLGYRTLEGLAAGHIFLAGASMYLALRFLRPPRAPGGRIRRLACLAGAVAFMFSDLFIVHFGNLNMIAVAAWMPLIFVLFHRALTKRRPWLAVWSGVIFAIATLAGHPQITLLIAALLAFRALWEMGSRPRMGHPRMGDSHPRIEATNKRMIAPKPGIRLFVADIRGWLTPLFYLALAGVVTLALSAPVLLPSWLHVAYTERAAWSYSETVKYSFAPGQFIGLLIPTFFGRGPAFHWGVWDRVEVGYIGVLPLLLAALGLALCRHRASRFLLGTTIAGFLVALGLYAMPHGWLYQLVPGFDQVRAPARFALIYDFGLAGLAALGLDALLRPLARGQAAALRTVWRALPWLGGAAVCVLWAVTYAALLLSQDKDPSIFLRLSVTANGVGLFAVFVLAGLALIAARRYGRIRPATLGLLAVGLIFIDLSSTGSYIDLGTKDPTAHFEQPAIAGFLTSDPDLFRIDARTDIDQLWQPDTAIVHGLDDVWGIVNPLALRDAVRYWSGLGSRSTPLYDALNVKYVIARKDVVLDWSLFELAFDGDPQLNVYRNTQAMPRGWVAHRVLSVAGHEAAYEAIHAAGFDPAVAVVLEGEPALDVAAPAGDQVRFASMRPNRIVLDVQTEAEGVLVLSEVYYPGWRATVNGRPAPVLRADYLFRGIRVPAGTSRVVLSYAPAAWWIGVGLFGSTVLALAGAWILRRRTRAECMCE